jgi:hypothetical protein
MDKPKIRLDTWLLRILAGGLVASYALFLLLYCLVCFYVFPCHMRESIEQQLVSPDGRYTAVLSYQYARENPIDGIYHVTLKRPAAWGFRRPHEVSGLDASEVDGERSLWIAWRAPETLVLRYSGSFPEEAFTVREHQWHGVRIVYQRQ